eukprot:gene8257-1526_t
MRKKIDSRIRTMVENCAKLRQRGLLVLIGDKARDQVPNIHYMLSKASVKARPSVLWCYKKDLHLSSHRKKRMHQIKKMAQRGLLDPETEDPFALFVASTQIRYCYYHETQNILGNTYGMCVLQDFEAVTPNLLARTVETVEGGGLVILLLSNLNSLTQLYSLTMDVHSRLRTESHQDVTGRFNERMVLSLASCKHCLMMDDELNVLPTSSLIKNIEPVPMNLDGTVVDDPSRAAQLELKELAESLTDTQPAGNLVGKCKTLDQARAVITFLDAASEKTLRSTVALTASRGRGKSAALGLAIAGALGLGYSNIFVTAPSPENLKTLFQFVVKGLDAMEYKEHIDYDIVESTNPSFGKAVVRVNVFRNHRQTVQYIQPQDHARLAQAELLVIDEAAAIPLPTVKAMLGPYLVFLCSTVNGYEGTGRSLSLKLIQQLREQGAKLTSGSNDGAAASGRTFREVILDDCELFYVERDTLFSYHKGMVSLYVSSHYKNTPNDLILMSDAPAHHLFCLLGPVDESSNVLPDILVVVQVALEGAISKGSASSSLARGELPQGDLIPWTIGQQYQDSDFPMLSGARIVRIAVHPELPRAGYGTRAVEILQRYYQGELTRLDEDEDDEDDEGAKASKKVGEDAADDEGGNTLLTEKVKPRQGMPPLLVNLSERKPERLHYLGVSFGLTQQLYNFWRRSSFEPVYLRQSASETTGENTIIMLKTLLHPEVEGTAWLDPFVKDFKCRYMSLMAGAFNSMEPALALSILDPQLTFSDSETLKGVEEGCTVSRLDGGPFSPYDLKRLHAYSNSLVDYHLILDLLPSLAAAYFKGTIPASLSYSQAAILLGLGLQRRELSELEAGLGLPANQVLALFSKAVRKVYGHLRAAKEAAVARTLPAVHAVSMLPHSVGVDDDLDEAAKAVRDEMKAKYLKAEDLHKFAITGGDDEIGAEAAGKSLASGGVLSIKRPAGAGAGEENGSAKKREKKDVPLYKKDKDGKKQRSDRGSKFGKKGIAGPRCRGEGLSSVDNNLLMPM